MGTGSETPEKPEDTENNDSFFAAPVIYDVRGKHPRWEPLSYQNIKELCRVQREFGCKSEFFRSLLTAMFISNMLVRADLKRLFTCLLPPSEYKLWKRIWKSLFGDLLPQLLQVPECPTDGDEDEITLDHLIGEGNWEQVRKKAGGIPKTVLDQIKEITEKAFQIMPSKEPIQPYISLKQSFAESFIDFVDRVHAAVKKRVDDLNVQKQLVLEVVSSNTNEACQKVILALPSTPPPTLDLLIEECMKKAMVGVEDLPRRPAVQERAVAPVSVPRENQLPRRKCFHCHQEGHFMHQYPFLGKAPPSRGGGGEVTQQKN